MATIRCPFCGEEIVPLPVEDEAEESATRYLCPECRNRLPVGAVDDYLAAEEEEASG